MDFTNLIFGSKIHVCFSYLKTTHDRGLWWDSSPSTGLTLASKTKMWLSAHRAEQWCSLGWRLQRLAPLTSLAAVGRRRRLRGAKTRLLEPAPRAPPVGWRGGCCDCPQRPVRGGCFDGPQRALKRGARYDQATATNAAAAAVLRWLSVLLLLLWGFCSRKANLGKGIISSIF